MPAPFYLDRPVLVTGANGFIGLRLVTRLIAEGNTVRALVLPDEELHPQMPGGVEVVRGDVRDRGSVEQAMQGMGWVLHLASLVGDGFPDSAHAAVTVGGTEHVLEAAAKYAARVVLVSSIVVYGDAIARGRCTEDVAHGLARGAYSRAKQAQETLAWAAAEKHGLRLSVVRPGNVFGPGPTPWVRDVCDKMQRGLPVLISGGEFNAGLTYVDNVVDVIVRSAALPQAIGQTYNALDGSDLTWRQYFGDLAQAAGHAAPKSIPAWVARIVADVGEFFWWTVLRKKSAPALTNEALGLVGAAHNIPIDKAARELGYQPAVGYAEALQRVSEYLNSPGTREPRPA